MFRTNARRVLLAGSRGFCAGVDRAVAAVEKALEQYGAPIYVRKQIVHNRHVVQSLEERGAVFVDETEEVPPGEIVVFSAHGVAPSVHDEAKRSGLATIDATCPLVTKVHKEAVRFAREGFGILLVGHEGHEEVVGIIGEAPERISLVDNVLDATTVRARVEEKVVWLSQTTLSVDETMATAGRLKERFPDLISPPSDDICYATQNRQNAVKEIAPDSDLLIVVGSGNSSNAVRLVEVAREYGARSACLIDSAGEIEEDWLEGVVTIGLTSGASVPQILVDDVLVWLAERGWNDVQTVKTTTETQSFGLPRELARTREELFGGSGAAESVVPASDDAGEAIS
ncbi:4-hydroxy-3-methylbut-2-enyl diphosphate reductase [Streptomyces sp. NPDC056069]|uniref:4-hydroxy-3-methylbut-2-enyl diphosphate reductase n=1 Tax=Streptomyces sp. NPDC056069 TaxID=3345702 RepID=UPI0035E1339B